MGTRATSDELGLDTAHRPGALTRYFAKRWLEEPSAKGEQIIAWLLEAALGKNALYFIEKTKEYVDAWKGSGEVIPVDAFNGFAITGDPFEDTLIPHAVLVWTCMNNGPWPEEVYHDWLDKLLVAGSAEAAYLAASLWPAHDLMAKVAYRPPGWLVYRGQLDAEAERLILIEMLKGHDGPRTSLYGSFEYDDVPYPSNFPKQYIERHGFTHPICGLVRPIELELYHGLEKRIQEALAAPSWSEGVKEAAMLLYLSLNALNDLSANTQEILSILEQNLFKLDENHINIINFHIDKIEKIDYNLIKDYINYLIVLYDKIIYNKILSIKIFYKYASIGLKTKDILYIGKSLNDIIFRLTLKEKEKVELWLKKQEDDFRIKDIFLSTYINNMINSIIIDKESEIEQVYKKIEDIYGKIKYFDKIRLVIDQVIMYFGLGNSSYKICDFIDYILKKEAIINFNHNFQKDYAKIINSWHPNRKYFSEEYMFLNSNHIGLYLYYIILNKWTGIDFRDNIKEEKALKLNSDIINKIIENLYIQEMDSIEIKLNFYLNKIENNNLPYKKIKYELIMELINMIENNYDKISECLKDENKLIKFRKVILSNIEFIRGKLINSRTIELLRLYNKSKNIIIY